MKEKQFSHTWMYRFKETAMNDQEYLWVSTKMNCDFLWKIGEKSYLFVIRSGNIISIDYPTWNDSWDFSIEGPEEAWLKFTKEIPPPLYNDLIGMFTRVPGCKLNGNRLLAMQNIRSLSRLFQLTRNIQKGVSK